MTSSLIQTTPHFPDNSSLISVTMASQVLSVLKNDNTIVDIHPYKGKAITEIISNGFFTVDLKWTVLYWNKAAENILGVDANDITGKNLWEYFAGDIPLSFYTVYHKAFISDIPVHFKEYWTEKGSWFDVITYHNDDTLSVSFKSSNPKPHLINAAQPEQQLKILNDLYRYITEVTNDCLWEWDLRTKEIFWIDGGHKRVFGYNVENALIPQSFWESLAHPDDKPRVMTGLKKMIDGAGIAWEEEYRFKKANGEYAYVHDRGHIMYDADGNAERMIGATQDISIRKLALLQLMESEKRLSLITNETAKEITHAVLTAQENERATIGREMHDNLNQILGATKLYIEMAKLNDENRDMCLDKASEFIVTVIKEIRRLSKSLAPPVMIMGLVESIEGVLDDLIIIHPIKIAFRADGTDEETLDKDLKLNIFRIVQEQLNNIVKHSKATHATIHLTRQKNDISLLISDNGVGCDTNKKAKGVGMINMRSRTELCHGILTVISSPGQGFGLKIVLPLNNISV